MGIISYNVRIADMSIVGLLRMESLQMIDGIAETRIIFMLIRQVHQIIVTIRLIVAHLLKIHQQIISYLIVG
jgi:hypothetical protein